MERSYPFPARHRADHPGGHPRGLNDDAPTLRLQFHWPVHFNAIRGPFGFSLALESPAIYWGRGGRCFAFLHDLTPEALERVMGLCAEATDARRRPWGAAR